MAKLVWRAWSAWAVWQLRQSNKFMSQLEPLPGHLVAVRREVLAALVDGARELVHRRHADSAISARPIRPVQPKPVAAGSSPRRPAPLDKTKFNLTRAEVVSSRVKLPAVSTSDVALPPIESKDPSGILFRRMLQSVRSSKFLLIGADEFINFLEQDLHDFVPFPMPAKGGTIDEIFSPRPEFSRLIYDIRRMLANKKAEPLYNISLAIGGIKLLYSIHPVTAGDVDGLAGSVVLEIRSSSIDHHDTLLARLGPSGMLGDPGLAGGQPVLPIPISTLVGSFRLSGAVVDSLATSLISFQSALLKATSETLLFHGGAIQRLDVSGLVCIFGLDESDPRHAAKCCAAALQLVEIITSLSVDHADLTFSFTFAIDSPAASVVTLDGRAATAGQACSVFGSALAGVAVATEVEHVQRLYGASICVTQRTASELSDPCMTRELDTVFLVDAKEVVVLFEVIPEASLSLRAALPLYLRGLGKMRSSEFAEALVDFRLVLESCSDEPSRLLALRCEELLCREAPWSGVARIESKIVEWTSMDWPKKARHSQSIISRALSSGSPSDSRPGSPDDEEEEENGLPLTASNMEKINWVMNRVLQCEEIPGKLQAGVRFVLDVLEREALNVVTLKSIESETAPKRRGAVDQGTLGPGIDHSMTPEMLDADVTRWFNDQFSQTKVKRELLGKRNSVLRSVTSVMNLNSHQLTAELMGLLETLESWTFDLWRFAAVCEDHPLFVMSMALARRHDALRTLDIDVVKLENFIKEIEHLYQAVPYHSNMHAADVLQATHFFLTTGSVVEVGRYDAWELFGSLFSSIVHDVDHPGYNNVFLKSSHADLAIEYNDQSPLENHHAATAFATLKKESNSFFNSISRAKFSAFREQVIVTVLATDLSKSFEVLGRFRQRLVKKGYVSTSNADRLLLLKMVMKVADVCNPMRPLKTAQIWTYRIISEFYMQGDRERELGLSISPMCDRHHPTLAKSQTGFIDFIVRPVVEPFSALLGDPMKPLLAQLTKAYSYWVSMLKVPEEDVWKVLKDLSDEIGHAGSGKGRPPHVRGVAFARSETISDLDAAGALSVLDSSELGLLEEWSEESHSEDDSSSEAGLAEVTEHSGATYLLCQLYVDRCIAVAIKKASSR